MSVQTSLSSTTSHLAPEREGVGTASCPCHEKPQGWWEEEDEGGNEKPLTVSRVGKLKLLKTLTPPQTTILTILVLLVSGQGSLPPPWRAFCHGFTKDRLWSCPLLSWFLSQLLPVCLRVRGGHRQQPAQQQGPEQRPAREELPAGLLRALRLPPAGAAEGLAQVR